MTNVIIKIKSYGILLSEFAAGGQVRSNHKKIEMRGETIVKFCYKRFSYLCLLREMGAGGKKN